MKKVIVLKRADNSVKRMELSKQELYQLMQKMANNKNDEAINIMDKKITNDVIQREFKRLYPMAVYVWILDAC